MVSPRKSRRKSECFSSTTTSMPARASRKPQTIPAGPPPTMQQRAATDSEVGFSCCIGVDLLCVGGNLRELGVEVGERAFELFAVTGALAGLQLFFDACAGEHQHASL